MTCPQHLSGAESWLSRPDRDEVGPFPAIADLLEIAYLCDQPAFRDLEAPRTGRATGFQQPIICESD